MDKLHEIEKEFREAGRSWSSPASNGTSRCRTIRPRRGTPGGGPSAGAAPAPAGHERHAGYLRRHPPRAAGARRRPRAQPGSRRRASRSPSFWPMKRFMYHNPIHGLEHLPFDQAVREGSTCSAATGYLANAEYRGFAADGRITSDSRHDARCGASARPQPGVTPSSPAGAASRPPRSGGRSCSSDSRRSSRCCSPGRSAPSGALSQLQPDLPAASRNGCSIDAPWTAPTRSGRRRRLSARLWERARTRPRAPSTGSADATPRARGRPAVALPPTARVGDWLEALAGEPFVEPVNGQMTKWVAAFVDEGMAGWAMPGRERRVLSAPGAALAPRDLSGRFLGIRDFAAKVRALPERAEDAIALSLQRLGVPEDRWSEYLSRHLAQLPGWAGLIRWLGDEPRLSRGRRATRPIPRQYLAVRLFYEAELADAFCRRAWRIPGTVPALGRLLAHARRRGPAPRRRRDASHDRRALATCERTWPLFRLAQFLELTAGRRARADARRLSRRCSAWLAAFPEDRHGPVWLEAYEDTYRQPLLALLTTGRGAPVAAGTPSSGADRVLHRRAVRVVPPSRRGAGSVRDLRLRRVLRRPDESRGVRRRRALPAVPGPADTEARRRRDRAAAAGALAGSSYASGTRWLRLADHLFHDLKQHPLSSLMLVDVLGFFVRRRAGGQDAGAGVARVGHRHGRRLVPSPGRAPASRWTPRPSARWRRRPLGFTTRGAGRDRRRRAARHRPDRGLRPVRRAVRARQRVRQQPVLRRAALRRLRRQARRRQCPGVRGDGQPPGGARRAARSRGIEVPDDTWFLAAKHITTSDRVEFYDLRGRAGLSTATSCAALATPTCERPGPRRRSSAAAACRGPGQALARAGLRHVRRPDGGLGEHPPRMGTVEQRGVHHRTAGPDPGRRTSRAGRSCTPTIPITIRRARSSRGS